MKLSPPFSFTKGIPVLKLPSRNPVSQADYSTMLFLTRRDTDENCPLTNPKEEQRMKELMKKMMTENDSPKEQFVRMGL